MHWRLPIIRFQFSANIFCLNRNVCAGAQDFFLYFFICFYFKNIDVHDFPGNYPIFCLKYWKTYFLHLTYLAISKVQWIFFFFGCKLQCLSKSKKQTQLYTIKDMVAVEGTWFFRVRKMITNLSTNKCIHVLKHVQAGSDIRPLFSFGYRTRYSQLWNIWVALKRADWILPRGI